MEKKHFRSLSKIEESSPNRTNATHAAIGHINERPQLLDRQTSFRSVDMLEATNTSPTTQLEHKGAMEGELTKTNSTERLLRRRKKYSQSKLSPFLTSQSPLTVSTPNMETNSAHPLTIFTPKPKLNSQPVSPVYHTLSPLQINQIKHEQLHRAGSDSPSKCNLTHSPLSESSGIVVSSMSIELLQARSELHRQGLLRNSNNFLMQPSVTHGSNTKQSYSDTHSSVISGSSLLQQHSTESRDSSGSMPSASSSSSASRLLKMHNRTNGPFYTVREQPDCFESSSSRTESHSLQRRSSYEMATGAIEVPQQKNRKYNFKNAFNLFKDKRQAIFGKGIKSNEEGTELSDPVYHLLRCAANPKHQATSCKCVCHLEDNELSKDALELASPIERLFPPRQHVVHASPKYHPTDCKQPASLPSLNFDSDTHSSPNPRSTSSLKHTPFSLRSIRFRSRNLGESKSTGQYGSVEFGSLPLTRKSGSKLNGSQMRTGKSGNPVFRFD